MRLLATLLLLIFLTGCAYLGDKVVVNEDVNGTIVTNTYSEDAYAQKVISDSSGAKCSVNVSDLSAKAQEDYMLLSAAGVAPDLCPKGKQYNYFNAKAAIATSRHSAIKSGVSTVGRVVTGAIIADAVVDLGSAIATNSGDRYNTSIDRTTQSTSNAGGAGDSLSGDGVGGEGAEGLGGSGGSFNQSESGIEANTINIGGNVSVAGDRSAAGDKALVNGDSSLISSIEDSEQKQSPTGEEQQGLDNSNGESGFQDNDGGNGLSLDF